MAKSKETTKSQSKTDNTITIRNVPQSVMDAIDAWIKELEEKASFGASYSRSGIALDLIKEGLERHRATGKVG